MTTRACCCEFHLGYTFFTNAYNCYRFVYSWENPIYNCTAFIKNKGRFDSVGFHIIHNSRRTDTAHFFITAKGEIKVIFRHKSISQQVFESFHNANHCDFGIDCASAPQNAINNFAAERRMLPAVFFYRNNIIVAHKHRWIFTAFAFYFK